VTTQGITFITYKREKGVVERGIKMNIIIVGSGKVGSTLVEQLNKEGHDISIIDINKDVIEKISTKYDVLGVIGNGASYKVQVEAGIEQADLLIAVTGYDELNLLCCLIAKKTGNCHTIARVRNPIYNQEINMIKDELGLSMIINPEYSAAVEISRLLRLPSAIKIETFSKGRIEILKFKIQEGSILHNYRLMDISTQLRCDVLVCTVERGEQVIIPNGSFILQENDIVSIAASPKQASAFFNKVGIMKNQVKDTMIVGGGNITYYLTELLQAMGIEVTIIEQNKERCEELSDQLPNAVIIKGDGADPNILLEEGIEKAESFAALTNLDEENILLSLYAKTKTNGKIITKVNRIAFDDVIQNFDLGSIICPKFITAEYIIRYVRGMQNSIGSNIETLYRIIENKVEALEFKIQEGAPVIGITLEKINLKDNILICSINRNGKIIIPKGKDMINKGDTVIIVTTNTGFKDIADILKK